MALLSLMTLTSSAFAMDRYSCNLQLPGSLAPASFTVSKKEGGAEKREYDNQRTAHIFFHADSEKTGEDYIAIFVLPNGEEVQNSTQDHIAVSFTTGAPKVHSYMRMNGLNYSLTCTRQ